MHLCGSIPDHGVCWIYLEELRARDSSYGEGTTNVTVTNTLGERKETEDAPIVKRGAVVTLTEAATSATYTVKAYDGMGNRSGVLMRLLEL